MALNAEALIARAVAESSYPARGTSWRVGLDRFLAEYNGSATATPAGQAAAERMAIDTLVGRFAIEDWIVHHPEVLQAPVVQPVFILGLPRAGTTFLMNLLALDPQHRMYGNWEANREVPPAEAAHLHDDPRIARKTAEVLAALEAGALDHRYHVEMGHEPAECAWLLGQDFKSYLWLVMTAAPRYFEWLRHEADMIAAYRHHKRALQVMQSRAPGQWLLKFPMHAMFLDALLTVYPDARIVATHRDPIRPLASSCSASYHVTAQMNEGYDLHYVGQETTRILAASLENVSGLRDTHPAVPVHDMYYLDFVADPLAEIHRLYDFMGQTLSRPVADKMRAAMAAHEAMRGRVGGHRYSLEEYGLSVDTLPPIFDDYVERFGIRREPVPRG